MSICYEHFRQNMELLGLPAPTSLCGNLQMALASVAEFIAHIDKFGQRVTVGEMIGAGLRAETLGMAAPLAFAGRSWLFSRSLGVLALLGGGYGRRFDDACIGVFSGRQAARAAQVE